MLFASKIDEVNVTISQISHEIEDLQARIEALRIQKLELEQYQQQLGSAENASESAIEQVRTALAMIKAISPDEVGTLKDALISLFDDDADIPLLASADPEPEPEPEPSDDAVTLYDEYGFPVVNHEENGHNGNGNGYIPVKDDDFENIGVSDIEAALHKLTINDLRKLAKAKRLDSKGTKFMLVKRLINAGITELEVEFHTVGHTSK